MPADPYLGEICLWPSAKMIPSGWLPCDGRSLSVDRYRALASLLGTAYGGDGTTSFALPDLRGRTPAGQSDAIPGYARGQSGGAEQVALHAANLPAHCHLVGASTAAATTNGVKNAIPAVATVNLYGHAAPDLAIDPRTLAPTGGNSAHSNIQPYLAMNYIIAFIGQYPDRM